MAADELTAAIREIQQRVRARHPNGVIGGTNIPIPDLTPLARARDAAEGKVAAIGTVNPRRGGLSNSIVQRIKKLVARALDWHVREQVEFNRAIVASLQANIETMAEMNRVVVQVAAGFEQQIAALRSEIVGTEAKMEILLREARELKDVRLHWSQWRVEWEEKMTRHEVHVLRTIADLQGAYQHRLTLTEVSFRAAMDAQHREFTASMERDTLRLQERFWKDFEAVHLEFEKLIHNELRIVRQRGFAQVPTAAGVRETPAEEISLDWLRFADTFRGSDQYVLARQQLYISRFAGHTDVLDIGCGRGEFLEAAKAAGISAGGIDLSEENVGLCRAKGLDAARADLFVHLAEQADSSLGGIYCSQVVEHLPPNRLPEFIRLAGQKLRRGALIAIETPNPECLAIFATHFYIDPTHTRPVPSALLAFYLRESGFGRIEVERLSPAIETMPSLASLPEDFRNAFFGALDYAIFAERL